MGFPLVPLLLVVELSLEGMSDRLCRPLHKCLTEELRTLQAPMHPRLLPAAFGDRGNPGIWWQCSSGGRAFPLFAKGDEEAGSKDWPSTWEGLEEGEVGMALGALCDGSIEVGNGLQGDAQLGHQCLDQQGIGSDDALIGGQRRGAMTSAERPWCARKKVSRVVRRASWAAFRVGQRLKKSQNRLVSLS